MKKRYIRLIVALSLILSLLTGCGNAADLLDSQANLFEDDFATYVPMDPQYASVLDTLDDMLDQYVSGLQKPAPGAIPQNKLDSDPAQIFDPTASVCNTVEEMKDLLLKAMANTEAQVSFHASQSFYSNDVLYDVIFVQLSETYMIETMGVYSYTVTTMDNPDNTVSVLVEFTYFDNKYTLEQVRDIKNDCLAKAKEIVRDLNLANLNTYERVAAVNQYLCDNCVYPATEPYIIEAHTIYGALLQKSAVCEGYARSTQLILSLCDVDSYYVPGDTPAGGHAWNLVEVDGQWYQLDVTWNDTDSNPNMYFLVTDDYMSLSRTWEQSRYPASATTPYTTP